MGSDQLIKQLIKERLEYLRSQIEAESISYGEIYELQSLREHIDDGDVQLLEWAAVPEHPRTRDEALEVLISAAEHWRDELLEYIAPASEQFDDEDSAESQYQEANEIDKAISMLRKELGK